MRTGLIFLISIITLTSAKNLRFMDEYNVVSDAYKMVSLMKSAGAGGFTGCMGHIGLIIHAYQSIATTFSTQVIDVIQYVRTPAGFKKFIGSVVYDFTLGFRDMGYDFFVNDVLDYIKIPDTYKESFKIAIEEGAYMEKNCLSDFSTIFNKQNKTNPNLISYVNLMVYHYRDRNKNKFDCIITTAEAEVDLMDIEYVWYKSKSVAGGITKKAENYSKHVSRDMTDQDVLNIITFFQVASYKELCKVFGVNFDIVL